MFVPAFLLFYALALVQAKPLKMDVYPRVDPVAFITFPNSENVWDVSNASQLYVSWCAPHLSLRRATTNLLLPLRHLKGHRVPP